jgi:hypothetical protein
VGDIIGCEEQRGSNIMSLPLDKPKAKLIIALMYSKYPKNIVSALEKKFGKVKVKSQEINFAFTVYYEKEFGKDLKKTYFCFDENFDIEKLADVKLFCFELEKINSKNGNRLVNIDPGYVTKNAVVLASFKERAHRIYLKEGVYADLELVFEKNEWHSFQWTFADIKENRVKDFLNTVKETL